VKPCNLPAWKYSLSDIDFDERETRAVSDVLGSKWLSMGNRTREFEERFGLYAGAPFALATANCTTALHLALVALGVGKGDEVIVPSLTFVATSNAILYTGARPVFADISSLKHPLVDPEDIAAKITKRTKAVLVMHYAGYPCEMKEIKSLARKKGLYIIEDAAHAVGSYYQDRMCGTIGDAGCFSFFANKNLPVGEGGMVVTRHRKVYERISKLRSHGMTSLTWDRARGHSYSYDVVDLGYNYRTTEISSAIGIVQLGKLNRNNKKRNELFGEYVKRLTDCRNLTVPFSGLEAGGRYARHLFPVVLGENIDRQSFMARLKQQGIQTSIHYPPVHTFSYYRRILARDQARNLNNTEEYGRRAVTLPLHPLLKKNDVHTICDCIQDFFNSNSTPPILGGIKGW
jgi:dTDP-4-amino-4,6-dideoxygalactose transaminase